MSLALRAISTVALCPSFRADSRILSLIKSQGTRHRARAAEASHLSESLGGRVEAHYYALGDHDVYAIVDLPDNVSATAASLAVGASGALSVETVVLLTGAEVDEADQKTASALGLKYAYGLNDLE